MINQPSRMMVPDLQAVEIRPLSPFSVLQVPLVWNLFRLVYQIFDIPSKPPKKDIDFRFSRLAIYYRQRFDGTRRSLVEAQRRYPTRKSVKVSGKRHLYRRGEKYSTWNADRWLNPQRQP